jgi:phosphotransferase system HPr (HPr) family protein
MKRETTTRTSGKHHGSLEEVLQERDFAPLLASQARVLFRLINEMESRQSRSWTKRHFSLVREQAHETESYLDDYDARVNKTFTYFAEIVASIRGFATIAHTLRHVHTRFFKYQVILEQKDQEHFLREAAATGAFLNDCLSALFKALRAEAQALQIAWTDEMHNENAHAHEGARRHLHHNLDETEIIDEEQKIAEVATKFLAAHDAFATLGVQRLSKREEIAQFVRERLDEERARELESQIHSIQSKYDTYIKNTAIESAHPTLRSLRGHTSLVLHLLEMTTDLIHFYERHENDIRSELAKERIAQIIDKGAVLDCTVNFCLGTCAKVFETGRRLALEIIPTFVEMQEVEMAIPAGMTLHARPISRIVQITNRYGTPVEIEIGGQKCSANSIMKMIMLAGSHPGASTVVFRGPTKALADLKVLFNHGLGEANHPLPPELDYLKSS